MIFQAYGSKVRSSRSRIEDLLRAIERNPDPDRIASLSDGPTAEECRRMENEKRIQEMVQEFIYSNNRLKFVKNHFEPIKDELPSSA